MAMLGVPRDGSNKGGRAIFSVGASQQARTGLYRLWPQQYA